MPLVTFLGAAQTVTGSKFLVEAGGRRVLVDCGLFQGLRELRRRNWDALPVDPASIDAVVLTHAHMDHSGSLPRLVAGGFRGRIFCTPGTYDLCRVVLPDGGRLQEEDARQANKHGYTRHDPAEPLFTEEDAYRALSQFQPLGFDRTLRVAEGIDIELVQAGHLLGSAFVRMSLDHGAGLDVLFGGDLGRYDRPVLPDPTRIRRADVLFVESTYGDRQHDANDDGQELAAIINDTVERGGKLIIPSFAIGRVEEVLYWIKRLEEAKQIPVLPVFLDSPMAIEALNFYRARAHELDPDVRGGARDVCGFCTSRFQTVNSTQQSKELTRSKATSIVISSSGMATGGRVLHHLVAALPDPRYTVLFVGYQAAGTRGRSLVEGAAEVKIHGRMIPVQAKVAKIDSMSAHADQSEILRWLGGFEAPPSRTFLVHGEPEPMGVLKQRIEQDLGWTVGMPAYQDRVEL